MIEKIKELFNKPIIRLLTLAVLALLAVFVSVTVTKNPNINRFGPLPYPQELNLVGESLPQTKISFNLPKDLKLPKSVNVYRLAVPDEEKKRLFFDKVASSLGASVSAEIKTFGQNKAYIASLPDFYFVGNLSVGSFSFTGKGKAFLTTSEAELKAAIAEYLVSLGIDNLPATPVVSYYDYSGSEMEIAKDPPRADILSLSYPFTINSLPIISLTTGNPLQILIEKKTGMIIRFDYHLPQIEQKVFGQYEVLTIAELLKTPVTQFKFLSLIDGDDNKIPNYSLSDISLIKINGLSLNYSFSPGQQVLPPVFVLTAEANLKDGRTGVTTLVLPAIKNLTPLP